MMRKLFPACLLLLACVAAAGQAQAPWQKFTSEEGRFSVLMPGKPSPEKETKQSPHGPYTTYLFSARGDAQVFLVGWVDYAPTFRFDVQKEIEANRDNFVKAVKGNLVGTTPIKLGTHPGVEFTAETEQVVYRSRVYVVGRRPYQLVAARVKGTDEPSDVNRFFSSFEITPNK